jgi:hypothetical protein
MQRCRCGECCKGGNDDPRTASLRIAGSPFMRAGRRVESRDSAHDLGGAAPPAPLHSELPHTDPGRIVGARPLT